MIGSGFYNIAHMTNTPDSVDWAVGKGANGVEIDVEFDNFNGNPLKFIHSPKSSDACDCTCMCPLYVLIHLNYFVYLSKNTGYYA